MIARLIFLLALTLPFGAQAQPQSASEVYRVTEVGGGLGISINQTVTFSLRSGQWIGERTRADSNWCGKRLAGGTCESLETKTHDRIDGATCPKLHEALRDLSMIPLPAFASPDSVQLFSVSDSALLTISGWPQAAGPGGSGPWQPHISISEYSGPFRAWWTRTEAALQPCWKPDIVPAP